MEKERGAGLAAGKPLRFRVGFFVCLEKGELQMAGPHRGVLEELQGVRFVEVLFFKGNGERCGAEAFADAGSASCRGCQEMLNHVDGPPQPAAGFLGRVVRSVVLKPQVDSQRQRGAEGHAGKVGGPVDLAQGQQVQGH